MRFVELLYLLIVPATCLIWAQVVIDLIRLALQ